MPIPRTVPDPALHLVDSEGIRLLLAQRLRQLRLLAGWKQSTLAERSGVSLPTLRRYERTGNTSLEHFLKLCAALGRLDEFSVLLAPPAAQSLDELEARTARPIRKRGRR